MTYPRDEVRRAIDAINAETDAKSLDDLMQETWVPRSNELKASRIQEEREAGHHIINAGRARYRL